MVTIIINSLRGLSTLNPKPQTDSLHIFEKKGNLPKTLIKPKTLNPKPKSRNSKPETLTPKPEPTNPKLEARNPKPEAVNL